jgi:cation diffusion facilitator CzcD-associated flavoprotein CzcO
LDGKVHDLDVLIFATGFDAIEGAFTRTTIKGRDGKLMSDHWKNGPTSYLGVSMAGFPNLFMIFGPQGPMSNGATVVEVEGNFIMKLIKHAESRSISRGIIEARPESEENWREICDKEASSSILHNAPSSWIFGTNVPGRKPVVTFYFPGLKGWLEITKEEADLGFPSYT